MKKYFCYLFVAVSLSSAISCKKSDSSVTIPITDTCKGTIHINYRGNDYNYTFSNHDSLQVAKIDQGNIYYDNIPYFSKRFLLNIPDKRATFNGNMIQLYANKINETEDTGLYRIGLAGTSYYGQFYFYGYTYADSVSAVNDTTSSFAHVTEFTRGMRNHMKGTFQLAVGLNNNYYYTHGSHDSVFYIKGEFDITK